MNFSDALMYPFRTQNPWAKLIILMIVPLLPLLGPLLVAGYGIRIVRRVIAQRDGLAPELGLPEWDDWGNDLGRGLLLFVANMIVGLILLIPMFILLGFSIANLEPVSYNASAQSFNRAMGAVGPLGVLLFMVFLVMAFFIVPVFLYLQAKYAVTGEFSSFFSFGEAVNAIIREAGLGATLLLFVDFLLFGLIGGILVVIGFALCFFPGLIVAAALVAGQNYLVGCWGYTCGLRVAGDLEKPKNDFV